MTRRSLTPAEEAIRYFRRSAMPNGVRFALLPTLQSRPIVFETIASLARRLHRDRGGAALQLQDHTGHLQGDGPAGRPLVGVYALSESGSPLGFLGWAWVDGARWRTLQDALYAAAPSTAVRAEAV